MDSRPAKAIAVFLVKQCAIDTKLAIITEARSRMAGPMRTEAVRHCRIQILDRGREPADVKEAKRN